MSPETIQAVGPWVTLVSILVVAIGKLWSELMVSIKREIETHQKLFPLIETLKSAVEVLRR